MSSLLADLAERRGVHAKQKWRSSFWAERDALLLLRWVLLRKLVSVAAAVVEEEEEEEEEDEDEEDEVVMEVVEVVW
ncbi:hypothetical protein AXG93_2899s1130 [Marchantia polymorpha subsp. ruderalis]|uniref:Uncharacterized protein n=1 Tax=Marchantia polymorpha subsp. ruderalis TaxID=1480154 RepID=A0A176VB76_MARPO|nr:hypothetical protein AXG93_2899s1130 [Marchantia polymorpha subsp. ruderalis]